METKNRRGSVVALVLAAILSSMTRAADDADVGLSAEERAWVATSPVLKVGNEMDWPPFDFAEDGEDKAAREIGTTIPGGSVFRVVEYGPGVTPRNHRTDSIDYAVVISGEIDMEMDGANVHLRAGDVLVQRGTIHNWVNNGTETCVIAFVLISAHGDTAVG